MATVNPLLPAVRVLSPAAKQAMYSATLRGPIKRGTWNGCAFDQAFVGGPTAIGNISLAKQSSPLKVAAEAFQMTSKAVGRFISIWDKFRDSCESDQEATDILRDALLRIGLFSEGRKTQVRKVSITNEDGKALSSLAEQDDDMAIFNKETAEMIEAANTAILVLS